MSTFPLRIPDDLTKAAIAQADAAGVSLNQYIATALAPRGRAKEILARSGAGNPPRDDDRLE